MIEWLKKLITSRYAGSVIRAVLAALSGYLTSLGINSATIDGFISASTELLTALIPILISLVWSWIDKKNHPLLPSPTTPKIVNGG